MGKLTSLRMVALVLAVMICFGCTACAEQIVIPDFHLNVEHEIPDNEAMRFVRDMRLGWNLGNTFDAYDDSGYVKNHMDIETFWCGTKTTPEAIAALHDAGFNTLRIPVSWHNHVDENFQIDKEWLDRVAEVADYALAHDMYVIINIHHDTDRNFYYPDEEHYEQSEKYIIAIWTQVAARFADYDDHVIFECINEPRLRDTSLEWHVDVNKEESVSSVLQISRLNQVFVDTVRSAGGNNATRYLMVPGYAASVAGVTNEHFTMPVDTVENRIIISVHAYTPYSFALDAGGTNEFDPANINFSQEIPLFMESLYEKYVAQGIPVIIGEFGSRDKRGNLQDRVDHAAYFVYHATARGMLCCWWDNHAFKGNGELFGILDRKNATFAYPEIVEAMVKFAPPKAE
ncbi:MAG: glycoside hydrolase family 5 protein [Clostridiales bacterium]|nr:glycoside hydrolase family 5 protein [Clostridiales bacterium]